MSDDKKLPAPIQHTAEVRLHDNGLQAGSLLDQSLSRLTPEQAQALILKAGEEALRIEVKNRETALEYATGKKVVEDHVETFNMLEKNGHLTRQEVTSDVKTGAGSMRIQSKSGITCFVASVAYENPDHPDVAFLRYYRDNVLCNFKGGQAFITWYWAKGPKIARIVNRSAILRKASRLVISALVKLLK